MIILKRYLLFCVYVQNTMRSDETVITQKLSRSGEKVKRLSTHPAEIPPGNFDDFTMVFLTGLDCFGLLDVQSTE